MTRLMSILFGCWCLVTPLSPECAGASKWHGREQLSQGYTLILPGILGRGFWDDNVAKTLIASEVPTAVEVFDWTNGPLMMTYNGLATTNKRRQAARAAAKIVDYQQRFPGRPVHVIGHSGGGVMVIYTLEALPPEHRVSTVVLLAAALRPRYDLRPAMSRTERGIDNYYSNVDVPISMGIALLMQQNVTAGGVGFWVPEEFDQASRNLYSRKLHQHKYHWELLDSGHPGGHFGWTATPFVRQELAPLLASARGPSPVAPNALVARAMASPPVRGLETCGYHASVASAPQRR